jgi:glycosyltransferase involved in cell wall biosynthesis
MARISLYAHPHLRYSGSYFGYAYTFNEIQKYLASVVTSQGLLNVGLNSPKAKVQLCYGTPPGTFYDHQYKIQMVQWESTRAPDSHYQIMRHYDEVWTANHFGRDAFIASGLDEKKIHVFEHGVDANIWVPFKRGTRNKIRFLHVDSGSPRKRADIAINAFKAAFKNNPDFELTLKFSYTQQSNANWFDQETLARHGDWDVNVRRIHENLSLEQLVALYHFHDILIYPSEGEGFGLIPLQAIATGMPVISTGLWASYSDLFKDTTIDSRLGQTSTIETYERPGDVVVPDFESTVALMLDVAMRIDHYATESMNIISQAIQRYSWQRLCQEAIDDLISRIGLDGLGSYLGYLSA